MPVDLSKEWPSTESARKAVFPSSQREALKKYPAWVPMFALRKLSRGIPSDDMFMLTLHELCTNPDMETVWRRLHKRDKEMGCPSSRGLPTAVYQGLYGYNEELEELAPKKQLSENKRIHKLAADLADGLKKYGIDRAVLSMFTDDELDSLFPELDPLERHWSVQDISSPTLVDLLTRIILELDSRPLHARTLIKKNPTHTDRVRLIRHLGEFFERRYQEQLLEVISLIVKVFLKVNLQNAEVSRILLKY
ncbi:hypothetical protein [Microbulbifer guangxiensis]|uniref:hypothetical protein n=1 Tax=Microbulbifer guangxiensis TaxID=2904249 RepID=UPI001F436DB6|nr:hypothetical protein [Microbulbifer guangxiensis]